MLVEPDAHSGIPQHGLCTSDRPAALRPVRFYDLSPGTSTALIPDSGRIKIDPPAIGDLCENPKPPLAPPVKLLFGFKFQPHLS